MKTKENPTDVMPILEEHPELEIETLIPKARLPFTLQPSTDTTNRGASAGLSTNWCQFLELSWRYCPPPLTCPLPSSLPFSIHF